jgi:hypothetical protein
LKNRYGTLLLFGPPSLLDRHILEFTRFEYLTALLALHVFRIFIPRDNLHLRMFAKVWANFLLRGLRRLARRHNYREGLVFGKGLFNRWELAVFWDGLFQMSSTRWRLRGHPPSTADETAHNIRMKAFSRAAGTGSP